MIPEIVKADKAYRKRLFAAYAVALLLLSTLLPPAIRWFFRFLLQADASTTLLAAETAGIGFLLLFILPSAYLIATGRRVIREGRWPHSGMKVIRDTVVSRGSKALVRGRFLVWLGAICIFLVAAGSSATHFIFYKFKTDPFFFIRYRDSAADDARPHGIRFQVRRPLVVGVRIQQNGGLFVPARQALLLSLDREETNGVGRVDRVPRLGRRRFAEVDGRIARGGLYVLDEDEEVIVRSAILLVCTAIGGASEIIFGLVAPKVRIYHVP